MNRRFLFLALILAALSAVLVYAAVSRSGPEGSSPLDVPVVVANRTIPAGTRITADMLAVQQIPEARLAEQALTVIDDAVGRLARYPIYANEQVLFSKIVNTSITSNDAIAYVLEDGMRGIAITVQQVIAVGGLVLPGDHVDVLWVPAKGAPAFTLLSDVEVTAVSQTIVDVAPSAPGLQPPAEQQQLDGDRTRASEASVQPEATTVSLMLNPQQSNTVFCAEEFAQKFEGAMRLAVRAFGDTSPTPIDAPPCPPFDLLLSLGLLS